MKLTRMDAVRFGQLSDVGLGPLGDGLTVVQGPNGAGKTSFTTLARYVLYGFPRRNDKAEPDYESSAGKRLGRLVFSDPTGEWVVERTEGVKGGTTSVMTLSGPEEPDLIDRVTRGVSRNEFRVVFGFGLQDMADIGPTAGSSGVLSRLYAARVGLAVSPQDVKDEIDGAVAALHKPGGSKPVINALLREMTAVKKQIRQLEDSAAQYAADRERLADLRAGLEGAREARDETAGRLAELETLSTRLESLDAKVFETQASLREFQATSEELTRRIEAVELDAELLEAGPQIEALLSESSAYREWLDAARRARERAAETRRKALQALDAVALDEARASEVVAGPETRAGTERHRDTLAAARARLEGATQKLGDAAGRTEAAQHARERSGGRTVSRLVPSLVMGGLGLAAGAVGLALSEWGSLVLGALLLLTAVVFALTSRSRVSEQPAADSAALELATAEERRAREALEQARAAWLEWAAARGLGSAGEEPEAASVLLAAVDEWRRLTGDHDLAREEAGTMEARCDDFRDALSRLVGTRVPGLADAGRDAVPGLAARVRELFESQRGMRDQLEGLRSEFESATASVSRVQAEFETAAQSREELLARLGIAGGDSAQVSSLLEAAGNRAREASEEYVRRAEEVARLEGELNTETRESEMARLRLELTGLEERLGDAVDRYAVLATASRLVGRTQAYYERARQPEVVRRAGELFGEITRGRYDRISIPPGGGEIVAYSGSAATPCSRLSRGSSEQLYLALRIALVEQLDGVGEGLPVLMDDIFANFDPERHAGAAQAVAELARHRQVVFFTCHPQVAELFARIAPDHTRLELERC